MRLPAFATVGALTALAWAAPAHAIAPCPGPPPKTQVLLSGQGLLESVITDAKGRLFFTGPDGLMRMDSRTSKPKLLAPVDGGGGLAWDSDGMLVVGYGNTVQNGTNGDNTGPSGLYKVDPETGKRTTYATGLSMANGVARAPDGAFYASNDVGHNIDKIVNGKTQRGWSHVESGNGMVVDLSGRYLFVNQTFRPPAIVRIDLAHPDKQIVWAASSDPNDLSAGLDGMAIDAAGHLFSAANGAGQIWRSDGFGKVCLLVGGLDRVGPSAVAVGDRHGTFGASNLYVVTFGGSLIEVQDVVTPKLRMRLGAWPRPVYVCGQHGITFEATTPAGTPLPGTTVSVAGRQRATGPKGRARFVGPFPNNGRFTAVASRGGYEDATRTFTVLGC